MARDDVLVSVIIPVYKVEAELERCVCSVMMQTYKNIEIILVNDGSPDKCPQMCDEYALQDHRVRVIHRINGGLSAARNTGLSHATGDYFTFVDSDDWISEHYVEKLLRLATAHDSYIAICDLYDSMDGSMPVTQSGTLHAWNGETALEKMLYQTAFSNSASGKLYHSSLKTALYFPEGKYHEDLWTTYRSIYHTDKVVYERVNLYCYCHRGDSISHSSTFRNSIGDLLGAIDSIEEFVRKECPSCIEALYARKFSCLTQALLAVYQAEQITKEVNAWWKWIKKHRLAIALDRNARRKTRIAAILSFAGIHPYIAIYKKFTSRKYAL